MPPIEAVETIEPAVPSAIMWRATARAVRNTPGHDNLDDIGRHEGEPDDATDLAGVDPIVVRNLPRGAEFPRRQPVEPAMGLGEQGDQALIGRRDVSLRRSLIAAPGNSYCDLPGLT